MQSTAIRDTTADPATHLQASIARFLDTRPQFSEELRDRLAVALKPGMQDAELASRGSVVLAA